MMSCEAAAGQKKFVDGVVCLATASYHGRWELLTPTATESGDDIVACGWRRIGMQGFGVEEKFTMASSQ
jgi:hypothetical protein